MVRVVTVEGHIHVTVCGVAQPIAVTRRVGQVIWIAVDSGGRVHVSVC